MSRTLRVLIPAFLLIVVGASGCAVGPAEQGRTVPAFPSRTAEQSAESSRESGPPAPSAAPSSDATSSATASVSARATGTPTSNTSTSPSPDSTQRLQGENHNGAAAAYVTSSRLVQSWVEHAGRARKYPTGRVAFLTFDDGPSTLTPRILDALAAQKVPASFFLIGQSIGPETEGIVKREIADGHSVCVHTNSHNYERLYPGRHGDAGAIVADHAKALKKIRGVLGEDFNAHCYRYPGGHVSWKGLAAADRALAAQQVHWLDWNALTNDAAPHSPGNAKEMVQAVFDTWAERDKPNVMVLLMHDASSKKLTADSLTEIIKALRREGFSFATLD